MRSLFPALVFLVPALIHGAETVPIPEPTDSPEAAESRAVPAFSLLPENSVLKEVMFPRYDENRKLASVLRAKQMTLLSRDRISGEIVSMQMFNPDRSERGRIDLATALLDQNSGILRTDPDLPNQEVTIVSERMTADGTGLIYAMNENQGYLLGPCTTRISNPPATAMNPKSPALRATALLGASFLPLIAAPPVKPQITPAEVAQIEKDSTSKAEEVAAAQKDSRTGLAAILQASNEANKEAADFIAKAEIPAPASGPDFSPATAPHQVAPDPRRTVVTSDGGMYFDAEKGVFVFLKNVIVRDSRFDLDGANELKIIFSKKEEAVKANKAATDVKPADSKELPNAEKPKKDTLEFGSGNIGDPEKMIATGAVRVLQKGVDGKEPIEASGAMFSYDLITGDIILRGGFAWVRQGSTVQTALEPNLGIRIKKNMEFVTDTGKWKTEVFLNDLNKTEKKDDKKEAPKPSR